MIRRINTLENIGRFRQLHSATGSEGDFAQFNVIYALNASGKSTLCDLMRSLGTGQAAYILGRARFGATAPPHAVIAIGDPGANHLAIFQQHTWQRRDAVPQIHVFDERFVVENVLVGHHIGIDQRRNLFGLVIGEAAIELHEAVERANERLRTATETEQAAKAELARHMWGQETPDSFREIPAVEDAEDELARAEQELERARRVQRKAVEIRQRRPLAAVTPPPIPEALGAALEATLSDAMQAAEAAVRAHLAEHANGLDLEWARRAHSAKKGSACPHCGQDMSGLPILEAYRALFSGELEAQEQRLSGIEEAIGRDFGPTSQARIRRQLEEHRLEQQWWRDTADVALELTDSISEEQVEAAMGRVFAALNAAVARKRASPGARQHLEGEEQNAIELWKQLAAQLAAYNEALGATNERIEREQASSQQMDLGPFQARVAECEASLRRHSTDANAALKAFEDAATERAAAQRAKTNANNALREESNRLFADYGGRINELLRQFQTDVQIVPGTVNFAGGRPSGELTIAIGSSPISVGSKEALDPSVPSLANTLSGGDRSALALAFFLAKVEADPELAESLVIFDDPFHSQDRSRRHRTVERIHGVARRSRQCFVLSHDLEFARHVEQTHNLPTRAFVLEALADRSTLECGELPPLPSRAYEVNYRSLLDFVSAPAALGGRLHDVAGRLRRVLEEYLQLKFPHCWVEGQDWLGTMIRRIREATAGDPLVNCQGLVEELDEVNRYSQRFHHRSTGATTDVPDPRELIGYVEQTLRIIQK